MFWEELVKKLKAPIRDKGVIFKPDPETYYVKGLTKEELGELVELLECLKLNKLQYSHYR